MSIIYKDILEHKSVRDIHKDLIKATVNPNRRLLQYNMYVAKRLKRLDKGSGEYYEGMGLTGLAVGMINYISVHKINDNEYKLINSELRKDEAEEKNRILNDALKETQLDKKIFFVASSHDDCAEDHKEAQGKIYVDQDWHNVIGDNERVADYISAHNIDTVQYIVNGPVYFITRPNCRHYFVRYSAEDILNGNYKVPHHKIGRRDALQTPRLQNIEYYQDRLSMYSRLYKIFKTDELNAKITKTKILVKKWKKS